MRAGRARTSARSSIRCTVRDERPASSDADESPSLPAPSDRVRREHRDNGEAVARPLTLLAGSLQDPSARLREPLPSHRRQPTGAPARKSLQAVAGFELTTRGSGSEPGECARSGLEWTRAEVRVTPALEVSLPERALEWSRTRVSWSGPGACTRVALNQLEQGVLHVVRRVADLPDSP